MKQKSIFRSFSLLTIITVIEKVIAFIFNAILAAKFGPGIMTDSYFAVLELFGVLEATAISALTVIALNRFSHYINHESEKKAFSFLSELLSFYLPIIISISVGMFLFAEPVSYVISPGFSSEARKTLVMCIRIMSIDPIVECITAIALSVLRQKRRFVITGLRSLFISVIGILFVLVLCGVFKNQACLLTLAYVVSMALFCLLTVVCIRKYGKLHLVKPKISVEIKRTVHMVLPLMVSYGVTRIALMIGKVIASLLGDGAVSELTYAHNLYAVVSAVFISNLSVILLTDFNEMVANKEYQSLTTKMRSVISVMTILLIPITVVSVICSDDVVKIVYERGSFTASSTVLVAQVLSVYALSFIPSMIYGIYSQLLYANGDTKTPMWVAVVTIVINLTVSFLLIKKIGLVSVAIGTLVSSLASILLCKIGVKKYLSEYRCAYTFRFVVCSIIAGCICVVVALFVKFLDFPAFLSFIVATVFCGSVFIVTLFLLKEETTVAMVKSGYSKLKSLRYSSEKN